VPRLRRIDCGNPGISRVRRGRGFSYHDPAGDRISDPEVLERIRALAIPPAWREVWICPHPMGHLQATGVDAAGRKQYRYHGLWRRRRDRQKFDAMLDFAEALPRLRRRVTRDLRADPDLGRRRVLACSVRLLDLGFFRIGSEDYVPSDDADEPGSYGLATIRKDHVSIEGEEVVFDYPGKSGQRRVHAIVDADVREIVARLLRRRGGSPELLAHRDRDGWHDVRSDDINDYVKALVPGHTAKDFRTWSGTLLAAVALAAPSRRRASRTARDRAIVAAVKDVAAYLGNTPAVARSAYIDPRVFDRYRSGWVIALEDLGGPAAVADQRKRERIEAAVIDLIRDEEDSARLEKAA